jgi:alkaline phosphatase
MYKYIFTSLFVLILISCTKRDDQVNMKPPDDVNSVQKKNIILMIGDGMGLSQITAARTVNNDQLNMLRCNYIGIQSTHAADEYVTDSGASATAMACGEKTNYYTLGVDVNGDPLTSIIEIAEANGMATGLITTSTIVHATPAGFFAHHTDRFAYEDIALQLINKNINFFMGGGQLYFDQRTDGLNLIDSLLVKNYEVVQNLDQVSGDKKTAVFIANNHPTRYAWGRGDVLGNSLELALSMFKNEEKGFFIMVEGAQIDWACDENDQDYLIAEMLDFDRAVGKAIDFAENDGNTLVIITGDHETGGYSLLDGDRTNNTVEGDFITDHHTGSMVPVFACGEGAKEFIGVYENTEIFYKMKAHFGL